MKRTLLMTACLALCLINAEGAFCANDRNGSSQAEASKPQGERFESIRSRIDAFLEEQKRAADKFIGVEHALGGAVLVAVGDQVLSRALGYANREWLVPATTDTKFPLWSVTKLFTAVAIMRLQERGKLSIEDTLCKYIVQCPVAWGGIKIRDLLAHTSGLPGGLAEFSPREPYSNLYRTRTTPQEVVALYRDKPLEFEPGAYGKYSNLGYFLLGFVIEEVSGETYEAALRTMILEPAGMSNTGVDDFETILPKRASAYWPRPRQRDVSAGDTAERKSGAVRPLINKEPVDPTWGWSAGAMYSTVEDVYKFARALSEQRILRTETLEMMWKTTAVAIHLPATASNALRASAAGQSFGRGLGWVTNSIPGHRCFSHLGAGAASGAEFIYCPDERVTIVQLVNTQSTLNFGGIPRVVFDATVP